MMINQASVAIILVCKQHLFLFYCRLMNMFLFNSNTYTSFRRLLDTKFSNKPATSFIKSYNFIQQLNITKYSKYFLFYYDYSIQTIRPNIFYFPSKKNSLNLNYIFGEYRVYSRKVPTHD